MIQELTPAPETKKPFPIQVLGDRVMVLPIMDEEDIQEVTENGITTFRKKGSPLSVSKSEYEEYKMKKQLTLTKCMVISVGDQVSGDMRYSPIKPYIEHGDIVHCFPTTQDAKMQIDGVEYWIYKEKAVVAKDI